MAQHCTATETRGKQRVVGALSSVGLVSQSTRGSAEHESQSGCSSILREQTLGAPLVKKGNMNISQIVKNLLLKAFNTAQISNYEQT